MNFRTLSLKIFILVLFMGCKERKNPVIFKPATTKDEDISVKTVVLKLSPLEYFIQSTGKIKAFREQVIYSEVSGVIKTLKIRNGDKVFKDEKLLSLDTRALLIKIKKINNLIYNSQLNYRSDLLSQESLLIGKSSGIKDTVYKKLRSSSGLTSAELELEELKIDVEKSLVRAPIQGTIANLKVQSSQFIKQGDELFIIYSNNDLYFDAKILETDISKIKIGQSATIVPISAGLTAKAKVYEINPLVDENGLVSIKLKINQTPGILPGMNAEAKIIIPTNRALIVSKKAIVLKNSKPVIFTFEKGIARWNYVVLGQDNGEEVEVLNGLKIGQKIIVSNNLQLTNDASVKEITR